MIALIDGDIVSYRVAAASEEADEEICLLRVDKLMRDILYSTSANEYKLFIKGSDNFRYNIYPAYKANRVDIPKPKHLELCYNFLLSDWNAVRSHGCETDDLLGINQTEDTIICSIDKDLLQIKGQHYNFVKQDFTTQTEFGGLKHFYSQLLQGDKGDNIPGIYGIGPKKAEKYLEGCETEEDMFNVVMNFYNQDIDTVIRNGQLLWIWKKEKDIWNPTHLTGKDHFKPEMVQKQSSMQLTDQKNDQLLEPTNGQKDGYHVPGILTDSLDQTVGQVP